MIVERPYKDDVIFNYFSILCNGLLDIGTMFGRLIVI